MIRGLRGSGDRGMTDLVGVVLLIGMVLLGATAVVVAGTAALDTAADQTEDDVAEDSMREMSARLATVSDSSVDEATSFQMEGDVNVSSATVRIEAQNSSTGHTYTWERSLGTIVYDRADGTRVAYQGGGLYQIDDGNVRVLNQPGLDYDNSTIDFSLVNVTRFNGVPQDAEVVARKDADASQASSREMRNALQDAWTTSDGTVPVNMTITIESEYAEGWAHYAQNGMTVPLGPGDVSTSNDEVVLEFHNLGTETRASGGGGGAPGGGAPGGGAPGGGAPGGGSEYDDAMRIGEDEDGHEALQVNQEEGDLTLMTAQIGNPVEVETVVDEEEYRDPMDVVFAIDETGSLAGWDGNDPHGERIEATNNFIDSMNGSNGDRAGYVQFTTNDAYCGWGSCFNPVPQFSGIVGHHPLSGSLGSVTADLDEYADGGTNITRGIDVATTVHNNVSDPNDARVMVVLTDGENTDGSDASTKAAAERAYEDYGITVHMVGLGDGINETFLEQTADLGGGNYYHADDASDLEDKFDEIANDTRTQTVHQINRTRTVLSAEQNISEPVMASGNVNVNDPDYFGNNTNLPDSQELTDLQPGGYLSFVLQLQTCSDYDLTDVNSTKNGTGYRHAECTGDGDDLITINNSVSEHEIFRGTEEVPTKTDLNGDWWHDDPGPILEPYTEDGTFDLSPEESIIALRVEDADGQSGYVLLHFEVEEIETEDSPGDPSDPDNTVGGGDAPRSPITIGYSEVGVS